MVVLSKTHHLLSSTLVEFLARGQSALKNLAQERAEQHKGPQT